MSKICTNCGREVSDESLFCPACGASFARQEQEQPTEPVQQAPTNPYSMNQNPYESQGQYQPQNQSQYQPQYQPQYQAQYTPRYQTTPPYNTAAQPAFKSKVPGKGFGIASMVLGIVALVNAFFLLITDLSTGVMDSFEQGYVQGAVAYGYKFILTFMVIFVGLLTVLSIIFGVVSVAKGYKKQSIAGLITGGMSLIVCIVTIIIIANIKAPTINELMRNDNDFSSGYNYSFDLDDLDDIDDIYDYSN